MWKERLISNLLFVGVAFILEFLSSYVEGVWQNVIYLVLFIFGIIAIVSVVAEVYPPKLKKEGQGNFLKNAGVYMFLAILTWVINYKSFFIIFCLSSILIIAALINLFFSIRNKRFI